MRRGCSWAFGQDAATATAGSGWARLLAQGSAYHRHLRLLDYLRPANGAKPRPWRVRGERFDRQNPNAGLRCGAIGAGDATSTRVSVGGLAVKG